VVGGRVCWHHGGATRQAQAKAAERVAFAEALKRDPARSTREIMQDVVHAADFLMRRELSGLGAEPLTPDQVDRLMTSVGRAAALVESARRQGIDAEVEEQELARADRAAADIRFWFGSFVNGMEAGWHLDPFHASNLRSWLKDAAIAYERGDPEPPAAPRPPRPGEPCRHAVSGPQTYCRQPLRDDGTCASGHLTLVLRDPPSTVVEQLKLAAPPGSSDGEDPDRPQNDAADDDPRLSGHPEDAEDVSGDVDVVDAEIVEPGGRWRSHGRYGDAG
jgi:hypothetical protein